MLAVAGTPPVKFTCVWRSQGRSKPNSSHFLSMWFVLASFYPEAQTFRTVQSSVLEFSLRLLWYSRIPQNKRHGVTAYFKNSLWSRLKKGIDQYNEKIVCVLNVELEQGLFALLSTKTGNMGKQLAWLCSENSCLLATPRLLLGSPLWRQSKPFRSVFTLCAKLGYLTTSLCFMVIKERLVSSAHSNFTKKIKGLALQMSACILHVWPFVFR